jgi:dTDP-4-amino-4,6-dideoxygalactose transaminase
MNTPGVRQVPFGVPDLSGRELDYLKACLDGRAIAGDGTFTRQCHQLLSQHFGAPVLLTHSCTAALENGGNSLRDRTRR